jgi:hypothetical protein
MEPEINVDQELYVWPGVNQRQCMAGVSWLLLVTCVTNTVQCLTDNIVFDRCQKSISR